MGGNVCSRIVGCVGTVLSVWRCYRSVVLSDGLSVWAAIRLAVLSGRWCYRIARLSVCVALSRRERGWGAVGYL